MRQRPRLLCCCTKTKLALLLQVVFFAYFFYAMPAFRGDAPVSLRFAKLMMPSRFTLRMMLFGVLLASFMKRL